MEVGDRNNNYKILCGDHFRKKDLKVHFDVPLSEKVGWRPHVVAHDGTNVVVDIVETEKIEDFQVNKYIDAMNEIRGLEIFVGLIDELRYAPDLIVQCVKYGIGILSIGGTSLREIRQPKARQVDDLTGSDQIVIMPSKPFGNAFNFNKCLRQCHKYLHWLELNLPRRGIEVLYDNIDDLPVESIKLLRAVDDKLGESYRDYFEKFHEEMQQRGIASELRVIIDRKVANKIHGRYLYTNGKNRELRFQMPPLNSLRGDQWDNIFTDVKGVPPFEDFWKSGLDVLTDWNKVKRAVATYLANKKSQATK